MIFAPFVACVLAASSPKANEAAWPGLGGSAQHSGRSAATGPSLPVIRWKVPLGAAESETLSGPLVGRDGTVYAVSRAGRVHAVNPDGSLQWQVELNAPVRGTPALAADGTLYVAAWGDFQSNALNAPLVAISAEGKELWRLPIAWGANDGTVTVGRDGTIYVGSKSERSLFAVDPEGRVKWERKSNGSFNGAAALSPSTGRLYATATDGGFYALNPDGTYAWGFDVKWPSALSASVGDDETVYLAAGRVHAFHPNGTELWRFPGTVNSPIDLTTALDVPKSAFPAIGTDGLVRVGYWNQFVALNAKTGRIAWSTAIAGFPHGAPLLDSKNTTFVGSVDRAKSSFYAIDADGRQLWALPIGASIWSGAAMGADGTLYFTADDGFLYAVGN